MNKKISESICRISVILNDICYELDNMDRNKTSLINEHLKNIRIENQSSNVKINPISYNIEEKNYSSLKGKDEIKMTKRKDGRWMARFTRDGKTYCVYAKSKNECEEKYIQAIKDYEDNMSKNVLTSRMKFGDYLVYYLDNFTDLKDTTLKFKQYCIDALKKDKLYNVPVEKLTFSNLKKYYDSIQVKSIKVNSYTLFKVALEKLKNIGYIKYNVMELMPMEKITEEEKLEKVKKVNMKEQKHRYINDEEKQKILTSFNGKCGIYYSLLCEFLFCEGLRIGELAGLKWENIDYEKKTIYVCSQIDANGNDKTLKTKTSVRFVPLFPSAIVILGKVKEMFLGYSSNKDYVFGNYSLPSTQASVSRYNREQNLNYCFHSSRHTFATNCYLAKVDMKTTQMWLGHSSLSTTEDIYTHSVSQTDVEKSKKSIEEIAALYKSL